MTGARVMVTAEDVPLLERITPGGKPHPIDETLRDGEEVTLGGTTLVARRTPGHTPGCTTRRRRLRRGAVTEGRAFGLQTVRYLNACAAPLFDFNRSRATGSMFRSISRCFASAMRCISCSST